MRPNLDTMADRVDAEEDCALAYVGLSVGPLGKEVSAVIANVGLRVGYLHRVKTGRNPSNDTSRARLMFKGMRRARGTDRRKLTPPPPTPTQRPHGPKGAAEHRRIRPTRHVDFRPFGAILHVEGGRISGHQFQIRTPYRRPILMGDIDPFVRAPPRTVATMSMK